MQKLKSADWILSEKKVASDFPHEVESNQPPWIWNKILNEHLLFPNMDTLE